MRGKGGAGETKPTPNSQVYFVHVQLKVILKKWVFLRAYNQFLVVFQVRKKDQINIETKNKTVRFIGELTKFKMYSKNDTLHCLKVGVVIVLYSFVC